LNIISNLSSRLDALGKDELDLDSELINLKHDIQNSINGFKTYVENGTYKENDKFFVIGPSHHYAFEGISIGNFLEYATPLGVLQSDEELIKELNQPFILQAHKEHSTEVQFPFIKYHFPDAKIVEAVYGRVDFLQVAKVIISAIHLGYKVIISTDLSHFYTLQEAKEKDNICMHAIKTLDINALNSGCEACGKIGIEGMIIAARELNLQSELLFYSTSADVNGDKNKVVGYLSAQYY